VACELLTPRRGALSLRNQALQGELNKARDEARGLLAAKRTAEEVSERMRGELARLQAAHLRAEEDAAKLARRLSETMAAEQEQIALLEDENTKLKQKNKTVELREAALQTQNTQTRAALAAEQSATQEQLARTTQLDEMVCELVMRRSRILSMLTTDLRCHRSSS
jgi:phage-related minor tail protein